MRDMKDSTSAVGPPFRSSLINFRPHIHSRIVEYARANGLNFTSAVNALCARALDIEDQARGPAREDT
jgi:hypothetical protein